MFELEEEELKECPFCKGTLQKGVIESFCAGSILNMDMVVRFCPEEEKKKIIKKKATSLRLKADGYYCEECWRFFGVYQQR